MAELDPLATLTELKSRLGIALTDTVDDDVLSEILAGVSTAIETYAGRQLRRQRARVEYFTGGGRLIRVAVFPISAVNFIRESWDRDWETAGAYEQLVEHEDYVLDAGGGQPGESGWIRRLDGHWLGDEDAPNLVQVSYDGGYSFNAQDDFSVPDDLRHAALLQAANDFQVRKVPGYMQETQRGVSISSGVSYLKNPDDLLPLVKTIAQRYSRAL